MALDLFTWAAEAQAGEAVIYATGDLASMRCERGRLERDDLPVPAELNAACDNSADAWQLYRSDVATLTQRRVGFARFQYIATRTKARNTQARQV